MPKNPKTIEETLNSPKYQHYGGFHRFMELMNEPIPFEAKMLKVSTEYPVSYRTAMRWYYKHKDEVK